MASCDFLQMMLQCSSCNHYTYPVDSPLIDSAGFLRYSTWRCPLAAGASSAHTQSRKEVSECETPPESPPQPVKGRNLWINTLTPSFLNGEIPRHVQQLLKGLEGVWAPAIPNSYMLLSRYLLLHLPSVCCRLGSPASWLWEWD